MAKKTDSKTKDEKVLERVYVVPLRKQVRFVPRYRKTNKALRTLKEFIAKHMKVEDRDLNKVKVDKYVNEYLWARGIKNPQMKVKVKAIKHSDGNVKVELFDYPTKLKFKKAREDKVKSAAEEVGKKRAAEKAEAEKEKENLEKQLKKEPSEGVDKKEDFEEKKAATVEAEEKIEKAAAKKKKHETQIDQRFQQHKKEHSKGSMLEESG